MNFIGKNFNNIMICIAITVAISYMFIEDEGVATLVNTIAIIVATILVGISRRQNQKKKT
ncbi:hypothetical protein [Paenisporosarcina sp. OV554]|uniref:hypothetical protein n=1 Tax=Paenisporosarcina sp. OV554 TaxID=2135694 RepID=UPI000D3A2E65|nr:hypothetical protein [Paenisporosarcina sp. OV554]PUB03123.1 hypothetical protein C8K15_1583 [Paenisporosarcina sp. OV554]